MAAEIADGEQHAVSFMSREKLEAGEKYEIKDAEENVVMEISPSNAFSMLAVSSELLTDDGKYTLWLDDVQIAEGMSGAMEMPGPGMMPPEGFKDGERPEPPEGFKEGERPEPPEGFKGGKHPEKPGEKN